MAPLFTVLLPITRPPDLLPSAIESVLEQTLGNFELCVICDGAPPETLALAKDYARRDPRVKVLAFPKGERHGEAHRHAALANSAARYVAHIADDDLWFPAHLTEMEKLLAGADFGNLLLVNVRRDGSIDLAAGDLARPETRRRMLDEKYNFFGPTHAGYRLKAYRRLPEGWAPAPAEISSDLHMWRKFLAMEGLTFATRAAASSLTLASPVRAAMTPEERGTENRTWLARIRDPQQRDAIVQEAWRSLLDKIAWKELQVAATAASCMQLDAELRRMTTSREDYRALLAEMTKWRDDYRREFERMTASRDEYVRYLNAMAASRDDYQAQIAAMTASRDEYVGYLNAMVASRDDYQAQLALMTASRDDHQAQLAAMTTSRDDFRSELEHANARAATLQADKEALARELAGLRADFDRLIRSKSWRMTAPLRRLKQNTRRVR